MVNQGLFIAFLMIFSVISQENGHITLQNPASDSGLSDYHQSLEHAEPADGSTLTGQISLPAGREVSRNFRGRAYRSRRQAASGSSATQQSDNAFGNTIISLHPVSYQLEPSPLENPAVVNQKNAEFIPHVTPVVVGSTVEFINNDSFYHNVFSLTPGAKFNIGRRPTGDVYTKTIPKAEYVVEGLGEIQLFCDIHSQMNAIILSLDTPYFTRVNEDGSYTLTDIPAGTYEIRGYNPRFDIAATEITLDGSESVSRDLIFSN